MALPGSREAAWPSLSAPDYFTDQLDTELALTTLVIWLN